MTADLASAETTSSDAARLWVEASHDLRQPVQAMLLLLPMLDDGTGRLRGDVLSWLGSSLSCLHDMLECITLLARIETGDRLPEARPVDVPALLEASRGRIDVAGVEIATACRCGGLHSDMRLLEPAVASLLLTAVKLGRGAISLSADDTEGQTRIDVTYRGLPPAEKQLAAAVIEVPRPQLKGQPIIGLGLGFAQRLVLALNGRLLLSHGTCDEHRLSIVLASARA